MLIAIVICLVAVLAIGIVAMSGLNLGGKGSQDNYGLFKRDSEIWIVTDGGSARYEITTDLIAGEKDTLSYDAWWGRHAITSAAHVIVRENGSRVFYVDKIKGNDLSLYYRDLDKDGDPQKIDSHISGFKVTEDGNTVVYSKVASGSLEDTATYSLYITDLNSKNRIATHVSQYVVSDACDEIAFLEEGDFYLWKKGSDAVKLATDVEAFYYEPGWSDFYYQKHDTFYKQTLAGEDRTAVATGNVSPLYIYSDTEMYYTKSTVTEKTLMDYVTDDLLAEDEKITEPKEPNWPKKPSYPYSWNYYSNAAYQEAKEKYNTDLENYEKQYAKMEKEYNAAVKKYEEKLKRDELREELQNTQMNETKYSLYYYNGTEEVLLTENLTGTHECTYSEEKPVVLYNVYCPGELPEILFSKLTKASVAKKNVNDALHAESETYVSMGGATVILEEDETISFVLSPDGEAIYTLQNTSGNMEGDLYKVTVNAAEGTVALPELVDSEVYTLMGLGFDTGDNQLVYYKNYNAKYASKDVYVGGVLVDCEIISLDRNGETVAYITGGDEDGEGGMLYIKTPGAEEAVFVSENVYSYAFTTGGDLIYLKDYNKAYSYGDLYYYNVAKAQSTMVAYEVANIFAEEGATAFTMGIYQALVQEMEESESEAAAEAPVAAAPAAEEIFVCESCGLIFEEDIPKFCPECGWILSNLID